MSGLTSKRAVVKISSLVAGLIFTGLALVSCGDDTPTARPTVPPTAIPQPPAPPAYLAISDYKFADQADKALVNFLSTRPDFPGFATWTQNNHWYILARGLTNEQLKEK